jgi:hypothetical protein
VAPVVVDRLQLLLPPPPLLLLLPLPSCPCALYSRLLRSPHRQLALPAAPSPNPDCWQLATCNATLQGKPLVISEYGFGGGNDKSQPTKDVNYAISHPFFGTWGYDPNQDPFKEKAINDARCGAQGRGGGWGGVSCGLPKRRLFAGLGQSSRHVRPGS